MKLCPRCATENAGGADFCVVCGEYLRWEPTRALEALTPADVSAGHRQVMASAPVPASLRRCQPSRS